MTFSRLPVSRPPVNIGASKLDAMEVAAAAGPPKPAEMAVSKPKVSDGKKAARATPISALTASRPASALSMSGRAVNRVAGGVRVYRRQAKRRQLSGRRGKILRRQPEQDRQGIRGRAALFEERCHHGAEIVHGDALLGNFQTRDAALAEARFDDTQNLFGVFEIELGDANTVVEAQNLRVKIRRVRGYDEAQRFAVELARVDPIVGGLGRVAILSPQIDFIADAAAAARRIAAARIFEGARELSRWQ